MSVFWCWPAMSGILRTLQPLPLSERRKVFQEQGEAGITRYYESLQAGSVAFQAFSLFVLTHVRDPAVVSHSLVPSLNSPSSLVQSLFDPPCIASPAPMQSASLHSDPTHPKPLQKHFHPLQFTTEPTHPPIHHLCRRSSSLAPRSGRTSTSRYTPSPVASASRTTTSSRTSRRPSWCFTSTSCL
jgi:hypothetical protein